VFIASDLGIRDRGFESIQGKSVGSVKQYALFVILLNKERTHLT
jgi:hypothetical protein